MEEQKKRRARRKFTEEFKARAVRLVLKEGQTVAQVARDLDLAESVLHGWAKQARIDRGMGPPGALTSEEREELSRLRKENRILKEEWEILKKRRPSSPRIEIRVHRAEKVRYSVPTLCRMLRVSRSGYYAWRRRGPSRHAVEDARLGALIVASHRDGRGTYGSPRVLDNLREWGERVSRKRVARLMKERNLVGEMKKRWRHPSSAPSDAVVAPNTLDRAFNVLQPNRVWASDITYVRTHEAWLYLAVVIDLFSRRVVGWSIQASMHTDIVLSALTMAVGQRLPGPGLLQHSDRGSQYTSDDYQRMLRSHGIKCSFSGRGNCWDNAVVESFFGTLNARAHSPAQLADPPRGRRRHPRVHRRLLQPPASPRSATTARNDSVRSPVPPRSPRDTMIVSSCAVPSSLQLWGIPPEHPRALDATTRSKLGV